jgi:hypothetical protein
MGRKLRIGLLVIGAILLLLVIGAMLLPTPDGESTQFPSGILPTQLDPNNSNRTRLGEFTTDPRENISPTNSEGVIEGSVDYPEGAVPTGLKVCAVNQSSFREHCTTEFFESNLYPTGYMYRLRLPPGEYTVYAQAPSDEYRAYYTWFAICGHREECQDHAPLRVTVTAGEVSEQINPQDWYDR